MIMRKIHQVTKILRALENYTVVHGHGMLATVPETTTTTTTTTTPKTKSTTTKKTTATKTTTKQTTTEKTTTLETTTTKTTTTKKPVITAAAKPDRVANVVTTTTEAATTTTAKANLDPWSLITKAGNDALYPDKFDVPLLNLSYPNLGYGSSKFLTGFHFFDIQGYQKTKTMSDCLILCNAHPPCRAMNYVAPLSRCVLLGSGTSQAMASKALWNNDNANSMHIYFTSGDKANVPSYQPQDPPAKLAFGVPAITPNIYLIRRQRIIGGTEAVRNSYPWIVRVVSCSQTTTCNVCGGTILPPSADGKSTKTSSDLVLTAAHCVIISGSATQPSQMYLKLGNHVDDVLEKHEILMPVRRIISNKGYNDKADNDITILQMQSPVTFTNYVNAIRLPTKDFPTNNNTCVAIGWGRFADNSTQAVNLQQTIMPIISYSSCNEQWPSLNTETTGRICASSASLNENSSVCQGDSGGPIFCQETVGNTKPYTIYGVTSQVDASSCLRKPAIFMRTFAFTKWITQVAQSINKYPDQQHTKV